MRIFRILKTKLSDGLKQLPYLWRSLSLSLAAAKGWTIVWAILLVVQGILPVATVYLTQQLVDRIVLAIENPTGGIEILFSLLLLMGGILLLTQVLGSLLTWVRTVQSELVKDYIRAQIHQKSATIDFAFYESPDYYDRLHRACVDAHYRPVALLENSGSFIQNGITLMAMAAVLIPFGFWLPVALLVSTLPGFYVVLRYSSVNHRWWMRTTADDRRVWYYDRVLTAGETAAELRLFDLGEYFQSAYQQVRQKLRQERIQLAKDESLSQLIASIVSLLVTGVALTWMVWQALQGRVTLGDLALFYQAFSQGQGVMRSLLGNLGQIYSNSLFLSNLFEFLALKPQVEVSYDTFSPAGRRRVSEEGINFNEVTFCYPGSSRPALENFNLAIPTGQIVAIVGANGAGKSTLIKLLCRLYEPQAGNIEWDGMDLRDLPIEELRRRITVLFQQPVHYNATAAENIAFGNLKGWESQIENLNSKIETAAIASGADEPISRLPLGYDTLLGKWFEGGMELSGGEWQRIALARAFLRQAPLIILDEPTSAMDSWAEADWLDRFRQLANGRTAIIITHRFTIAKRADTIHVMADGRIVESGCHDELLNMGGLYARSWKDQMRE